MDREAQLLELLKRDAKIFREHERHQAEFGLADDASEQRHQQYLRSKEKAA